MERIFSTSNLHQVLYTSALKWMVKVRCVSNATPRSLEERSSSSWVTFWIADGFSCDWDVSGVMRVMCDFIAAFLRSHVHGLRNTRCSGCESGRITFRVLLWRGRTHIYGVQMFTRTSLYQFLSNGDRSLLNCIMNVIKNPLVINGSLIFKSTSLLKMLNWLVSMRYPKISLFIILKKLASLTLKCFQRCNMYALMYPAVGLG